MPTLKAIHSDKAFQRDLEAICQLQIKKGMKFALTVDAKDQGSKKGDVVKVTSVSAMGVPSDGHYNDYEMLRVSNGKFSWRISRESLKIIK